MDYNTDNFFGFSVLYVFADNTKMYLVGSLKRAVRDKHGCYIHVGTFRDFLKEERTRVLMKRMYKKSIEYVDNPSKKPIIDLQYVKKYIEDSFNIKHVEITK